jgi:hypothetical protein
MTQIVLVEDLLALKGLRQNGTVSEMNVWKHKTEVRIDPFKTPDFTQKVANGV